MIYGMKDAANLILVDKATNEPALYVGYANATSSEWTSESVYATAKGTNAIRWDNARNGTLTLDTEVFDFGLLAMTMGSEIKEGDSNIFTRVDATLDDTRKINLGEAAKIDESTLSVLRLRDGQDDTEHVGRPIYNASIAKSKLPLQVTGVRVEYNDKTATISFNAALGADEYQILRGGEVIATRPDTNYKDEGLTAETAYEYSVIALNEYGKGPESAKVAITTATDGETATSVQTADGSAIAQAQNNVGEVYEADGSQISFTYENGVITFNELAVAGDAFAVYYMEAHDNVRTLTIKSDKFAGAYEIFADALIRPQDGSADEIVQIHYPNARPQSNFTLTQSATEPTSLSIVFDLLPQGDTLAEFKVIQ